MCSNGYICECTSLGPNISPELKAQVDSLLNLHAFPASTTATASHMHTGGNLISLGEHKVKVWLGNRWGKGLVVYIYNGC